MAYDKKGGKMPSKSSHYTGGNTVGGKGKGSGSSMAPPGASNTGASTGIKKKDDMRADVTKQPTNKNPYPDGLA